MARVEDNSIWINQLCNEQLSMLWNGSSKIRRGKLDFKNVGYHDDDDIVVQIDAGSNTGRGKGREEVECVVMAIASSTAPKLKSNSTSSTFTCTKRNLCEVFIMLLIFLAVVGLSVGLQHLAVKYGGDDDYKEDSSSLLLFPVPGHLDVEDKQKLADTNEKFANPIGQKSRGRNRSRGVFGHHSTSVNLLASDDYDRHKSLQNDPPDKLH